MVLARKLAQPVVSGIYLDRPRLYSTLARWQSLRALVIRAHAGYGKSSLVSRWLTVAGAQVDAAWLTLDEDDGDPGEFVHSIAAALDTLVPGALAAAWPIPAQSQAAPQQALNRLLLAIQDFTAADGTAAGRHLLLVLDDLHLVRSPVVDGLLMAILERGPVGLHLVLLSRRALTLPLARLYAAEQIVELGVDDLRFTADEVRRYLRRRGFKALSEAELQAIVRRSEGWVLALQLATITQPGSSGSGGLLAHLHGNSRWLAEYLTGEVLTQQTPEVRRFLLQTAILDDFSAPLCAAVTGSADAPRMLAALVEADLFVIALDEQRTWFSYHPLFRELLLRHLTEAEGKTERNELHCRAAAWLAEAGRVPDALGHLRAAGADSAAVDLVAGRIAPVIMQDPYSARRWLELLPSELLSRHPQLMLDRCRLEMLFDNKELLTQVGLAEAALAQAGLAEPHGAALGARLQVYRAVGHFLGASITGAARQIEQAREGLPYLDNFDRGTLAFLQMHLCSYEGRQNEVPYHATRALAAFARIDWAAGVLAVRRELARRAFRMGRRDEANDQYEAIFAAQSADHPFVALDLLSAYLSAAEHRYWQNDLAQARVYHRQALQLAERLKDETMLVTTTWYEALFAHVDRARIAGSLRLPASVDLVADRRYVDLQIQLLMLARRFEDAWRVAEDLGPHLDSDPATFSNRVLLPFLAAYIARGIDLHAVLPLLERTLHQRSESGDRFCELQLLSLKAWYELKQDRHSAALATLTCAVGLSRATGYVRVILDIPDLLPLLAQLDDPALGVEALRAGVRPGPERIELTAQERTVLELLAQDFRYEQIAQRLTISINTVRTHVRHIYKKLGTSRRAQALQVAQGQGLIVPGQSHNGPGR